MMEDEIVRIARAQNGFTVEMRDPAIVKRNREASRSDDEVGMEPRSPFVSFVFESAAEVQAFIGENLETALPLDEFETSFKEAVEEGQ
jgi:hypothetical protein